MIEKAWVKIGVVLFSLVAGGVFIWQSTQKLSRDASESGASRTEEEPQKRPLMSGSKTRSEMLMEVDSAWELAVPPLEENPEPVEEE